MRMGGGFGKFAVVLTLGVFTMSAMAGFWDWTRPFQGPGRQVSTLVITGNYKRPLALAQLIRAESRQPYLLIPAQESGLNDVYFCPVSEKTPAMRLRAEDISRFVRLLNPTRVVVLGDTRYVPERFVPVLDGRIPIIRIDCDDWTRNAETLNSMLNLNNLQRDYAKIGPKLDRDALYRPLPTKPEPAPLKAPDAVEAPKVPDQALEPAKPAPPAPTVPAAPDPAAGEVTPAAEVK